METLIIVIALTFTQSPNKTKEVTVTYESTVGITPTAEHCQNIKRSFAEARKNAIVICIDTEANAKKKPRRQI